MAKTITVCVALMALALVTCAEQDSADETPQKTGLSAVDVKALHDRLLTIDTHVDVPRNFATSEVDPGAASDAQVNIPKMIAGGLDAVFFSAAVGQTARSPEAYERARRDALVMIGAIRRMTDTLYPDTIELARSADDFERIRKAGKLAASIGLENGFAIGKDLGNLKEFYDLGVRYITLVHIGHNDIADSSFPVPELGDGESEHGGVSRFGREVIAEMNRLGIMIDVSHISKQAMLDAARLSKAPIIASHSAVRALRDVARNLDDEQLINLRDNGGVVQIVGYSAYIAPNSAQRTAAIESAGRELGLTGHVAWGKASNEVIAEYGRRIIQINQDYPPATVAQFVDHIDYVVRLIGIDHVGIGSDFYTGGGASSGGLDGWMDATESVNVTAELVRRGYGEDEIGKIWGRNLLRVMREVENVASRLTSLD